MNGKSVNVDVDGNLNIAGNQDTTNSDTHQSSEGGGIAIGGGGASGSFSTQQGNANANYAGVTEQSAICTHATWTSRAWPRRYHPRT